jgi:Mn2+/Fe2+ NRAMP family transporter
VWVFTRDRLDYDLPSGSSPLRPLHPIAPELGGRATSHPSTELGVETAPRRWRLYLRSLGPGLVSGAADTDPTTVATLAVIGAGTVYRLAWLTLLLFPVIAVIQVVATHVGVIGRRDLQTAVAHAYGRIPRWLLLVSILAVNVVTIGADLEGGAAAIGLLTHLDWRWFVLPLSLVLLALLTLGGYDHVQRALKYLLLCLLAYAAAAIFAHPDWGAVVRGSLIPHFEWRGEYTADALSLLGTTVTSYVYVWQTVAQSEQHPDPGHLRLGKFDAILGGFFAVAVFWCILVATGATLGEHHLHANTAADAARALRPVAGSFAGGLFALGLLASAVVALPVLMATTAYVTGAQMHWRRGLSLRLREAPLFYAALAAAALIGTVVALIGISPIRLLFIAGIVGGLATPVGLILLLAVGGDRTLMRGRPVGRPLLVAGWAVTAVLTIFSLAFVVQQLAAGA